MSDLDRLTDDLARLGRALPTPPPSADLATAVMERVASLPTPASARVPWLRRLADRGTRWQRRAAVAVVALLVALLATPPVRAAVADWFGFAGVIVERGPVGDGDAGPPASCEGRADGGRGRGPGRVHRFSCPRSSASRTPSRSRRTG